MGSHPASNSSFHPSSEFLFRNASMASKKAWIAANMITGQLVNLPPPHPKVPKPQKFGVLIAKAGLEDDRLGTPFWNRPFVLFDMLILVDVVFNPYG